MQADAFFARRQWNAQLEATSLRSEPNVRIRSQKDKKNGYFNPNAVAVESQIEMSISSGIDVFQREHRHQEFRVDGAEPAAERAPSHGQRRLPNPHFDARVIRTCLPESIRQLRAVPAKNPFGEDMAIMGP